MKHIFGVVLLSILCIDGFCQEPGIAPVDPEFTEYMQSGYLKNASVVNQPMGYIPQVYRINALYDIPEGESLSSNSVEVQIRKPGEVYLLTIGVEGAGITTPAAGEYYIKEGDPVEIFAAVEEGFEFADWKMDEIIMTSEPAFSFNMPMFDVKITSHFNVVASANPVKVNSLVVFPLPFDDELSIVSDNIITRIEVLSMSGHLISAFSPGQKSELKLNLGFLPQGIYILKIIDINNSEAIRRISKN